jgi:hypothetical protein
MAEKKKRAAKSKSAVMLTFDTAKAALKTAKEAVKKADNERTQAALETAKANLKTASGAAARERFVSVGGTRVLIVLDKLKNLARIASAPRSYTFTESDAQEIIDAVNNGAEEVERAFKAAMASPTAGGEKKRAFVFSSTQPAKKD